MAKSLNPAELNLDQYLPARKPLVQEKLTGLLNTEMPTVGQLLGLILEEDQALLKLAQLDTNGKINLLSVDVQNIAGQITNTDSGFRDKIIKPDIAAETILAETASYRDSLAQLEAQRLKISGALEELESQGQQLKNAKSRSGKLETGFNLVLEKVGDRPIPVTVLAALFGIGLEKPPSIVEQVTLPAIDLDQIAHQATSAMASLFTRKDERLDVQMITKLQERRKYQAVTMPEDVDLNALLEKRGINLFSLEKTTGKPMLKAHVIRTMPKFIATDLRFELNQTTVNLALDLMAQGAITDEDLRDRESLTILVNALMEKANSSAPVKGVVQVKGEIKAEEVEPVTKMVSRDGHPFDPKPKEFKPVLVIEDDDPLALIFTKIAKNDYLEITEPGLLAAAMKGRKVKSEGKVSAAARNTAMEKLRTNIITLTDTAKSKGILTLGKLADSNDIAMPDEMRTFFKEKCPDAPIGNIALIEGQIEAGYHQEKAKTLDQLALKLQKIKLSGR
jgi:hypothetical protein